MHLWKCSSYNFDLDRVNSRTALTAGRLHRLICLLLAGLVKGSSCPLVSNNCWIIAEHWVINKNQPKVKRWASGSKIFNVKLKMEKLFKGKDLHKNLYLRSLTSSQVFNLVTPEMTSQLLLIFSRGTQEIESSAFLYMAEVKTVPLYWFQEDVAYIYIFLIMSILLCC